MRETRKKKLPAGLNTVISSVLAAGEPETDAVRQPGNKRCPCKKGRS